MEKSRRIPRLRAHDDSPGKALQKGTALIFNKIYSAGRRPLESAADARAGFVRCGKSAVQ